MRVLHVHKATGVSGSERHLLTLLPALRDAGVEVHVAIPIAAEGMRFVDALRAEGLTVTALPAGPDVNPLLVTRLVRLIRAVRPTIVHTHLVHADLHGLIAARLARVPAVSSDHTPPTFNTRTSYRWVGRLSGRLARRRLAISEHVGRGMLAQHQGREGFVDVVPYGIDVRPWQHVDPLAIEGIDPQRHVVAGIASRLVPGKGHDVLLDAIGLIAADVPNLRVVVAGEGPLRTDLEARAAALPDGMVRFLGFVKDVPALMAACDFLVFPTSPALDEGFGLVALEAMAAGRPVIATRFGPIPEVVDDGGSGILVEPDSAKDLAAAMTALIENPEQRTRMGAVGRTRVESEFTVERMVQRTIAMYQRALGSHSHS